MLYYLCFLKPEPLLFGLSKMEGTIGCIQRRRNGVESLCIWVELGRSLRGILWYCSFKRLASTYFNQVIRQIEISGGNPARFSVSSLPLPVVSDGQTAGVTSRR